jgi:hypothetical protein
MKQILLPLLAATFSLVAQTALAGPQCNAPKDKWVPADLFQKRLVEQGYQIKKFKETTGGCYEIYGHDKSGQKVEIYFDPATGNIVKQK